jgi:hypothetical protein
MSNFRTALRTARSLLASGLRGQSFIASLNENIPQLSGMERDRLAKAVRREYNILGQAAHDPNIYRDCKSAKEAKDKNPNKHLIIATYQTPMCSTCTFKRQGSCGLMGGEIVGGPTALNEKLAKRTASILLNEGEVPREVIQGILANKKMTPSGRVAALHGKRGEETVDQKKDIAASQSSRRTAAILEPDQKGLTLKPKRTLGPRKASNQEDSGLVYDSDEGDQTPMGKLAATLRPSDMRVRLPGDMPRQTSRQASIPSVTTFQVPKKETGDRRRNASTDEHLEETQRQLNIAAKKASNTLAQGKVTPGLAGKILSKMNDYVQHGARHSEFSKRIAGQLGMMCGALEI